MNLVILRLLLFCRIFIISRAYTFFFVVVGALPFKRRVANLGGGGLRLSWKISLRKATTWCGIVPTVLSARVDHTMAKKNTS